MVSSILNCCPAFLVCKVNFANQESTFANEHKFITAELAVVFPVHLAFVHHVAPGPRGLSWQALPGLPKLSDWLTFHSSSFHSSVEI